MEENHMAARTFKEKKQKKQKTNKQSPVFFDLFFMFTITLITEEVLGRRISLGENHSGENERQWKNKSEHEHRKQNLG